MSFILLIVNIVIKANTSSEIFPHVIPHGAFFSEFHEYMIGCATAVILSHLITFWIGRCCMQASREKSDILTDLAFIPIFTSIITLILTYWQMGRLWHVLPDYTIFFYNPYWTKGLCDFSQSQLTSTSSPIVLSTIVQWPYILSDIVVRIYSFFLMVFPVAAGTVAGCVGSATAGGWLLDYCYNRNNSNLNQNNLSHV